eukprot:UN10905
MSSVDLHSQYLHSLDYELDIGIVVSLEEGTGVYVLTDLGRDIIKTCPINSGHHKHLAGNLDISDHCYQPATHVKIVKDETCICYDLRNMLDASMSDDELITLIAPILKQN